MSETYRRGKTAPSDKLGEWHSASHVERQKKKKDEAPGNPPAAKP